MKEELRIKQELIIDIVKMFLDKDLIIKGDIAGIYVYIEDGYINASWKFNRWDKTGTIEDYYARILTKEEDMYLMGEQDIIYDIIAEFLKTELAIKNNMIGVDIILDENRNLNYVWKYGQRKIGDIIE